MMNKKDEKNGMLTHYDVSDIENILAQYHGEKYIEYRKLWEYHNNMLVPSIKPLYVVLEVNTYCNLKCKMCEKNYYTKAKKNISSEVINKLVDECKEIQLPSIAVGAAAEAFMMPNIREILMKVKEIGAIDNFLFTNGTKLNHDMNEFLVDNHFERLYVSLDAATKETYKKIRGADLELVENNILDFLSTREEKKSQIPLIRVSFVRQKDNENEVQMFVDKWKDKVDIIDIQEMRDFSNLQELQDFSDVKYCCQAPFTTLSLDCEGNIYPCCTFYRKFLRLGNIKTMTLMDAWNSRELNELREQIIEGKLCKACRNCAKRSV